MSIFGGSAAGRVSLTLFSGASSGDVDGLDSTAESLEEFVEVDVRGVDVTEADADVDNTSECSSNCTC